MQLRSLLLACVVATAAAANEPVLEKFTLDNGEVLELDPSTVTDAMHPDNDVEKRGDTSGPVNPKQLFKRVCSDPAFPVTCQGGNWCCQPDDFCCEGRSCVDPDIHNCCLYGYYCNKPAVCRKLNNGNIICQG